MTTIINDSARTFQNKDHQSGQIMYDPYEQKLAQLSAISGVFMWDDDEIYNSQVTTEMLGMLWGVAYVGEMDYLDEVDTVNEVTTVQTVNECRLYGYSDELESWTGIEIDHKTNSLVAITEEHHKIHEGNLYTAYRKDTLATNDTIAIVWEALDSDIEVHLDWLADVGGECVVDMVEDVTSYTGGTAFTPVNRNRRSANVSVYTVKVGSDGSETDPLVLTGGTVYNEHKIGAGRTPAGTGSRNEWILKRNSITVLRLTAVANNISCGLRAYWYEVTVA